MSKTKKQTKPRPRAKERERVKDLAAQHWHKKRRDGALAAQWSGVWYMQAFALHQIAFVAGYDAARPKSRKGATR